MIPMKPPKTMLGNPFQGTKPETKGQKPAEKPAFTLDSSRVFTYRSMVESIFRCEGPTKSRVGLTTREKYGHPLTAGINPDTWDVDFILREGLSFPEDPLLRRFMEQFRITDPFEDMLSDVGRHEIGHWEYPRMNGFGCPFDKPTYYTSFIEPIYDELKRSGKFNDAFCKALSERMANAVTDVIDNSNVASVRAGRKEPFSGQSIFWYLQGVWNGRYSKEYSLFVKLNLKLIGNKHDKRLLGRFMEEGSELGQAVQRLAKLFTPEAAYSREHWEGLARAYTKEALKFIDKDEAAEGFTLQYSTGDNSAQEGEPQQGQGGGKQGKKGKEKKDGEEQGEGEEGDEEGEKKDGKGGGKGNEDDEKEEGKEGGEGSEDAEKDGDKKGKKQGAAEPELGKDLTKGEIEKIMMGRKAGQGVPFFISQTDGLDAYYTGLAKRIIIKAAGKLPGAQMPLVPLLYEPYDEEIHSPEDISMSRLSRDYVHRRVIPSVVKSRIAIDIPIKKEKRHLPDFLMTVIDSSGSMMGRGDQSIIPWGDQSYYHFALLTWYGIRRFFESERILHKMGMGAAIFSDVTLTAKGLDDVKKLLLNPVTGGTTLDLRKVINALSGKQNAIFSMMSDGEITNWYDVREDFIALAKRNQFFMIRIGGETVTSRDMEAAGLLVKPVDSPKEAFGLSIDLTVQKYRAAVASGVAGEAKKYRDMVHS